MGLVGIRGQAEAQDGEGEKSAEGMVSAILEEKMKVIMGEEQLYQRLLVRIKTGTRTGEEVEVESGNLPIEGLPRYQEGDQVLLVWGEGAEEEFVYIADFVRRKPLGILFLIFTGMAVLIAGWRGISSLLGMAISFMAIFMVILPLIYAGGNPIKAVVWGSLFIIPASFYLSHGINRKTSMAVLGTFISLLITSGLAFVFVEKAKLTGFASEEASFLQASLPGVIKMKGLLLAGIMVGILGVLDDVTVSQAAIVEELRAISPEIGRGKLFQKAMRVGRDHIASMINTLVLVYAGASLPLLLLFVDNSLTFKQVINYEIVADEVVRTLVASIGLMLAVPLTTFFAVYWGKVRRKEVGKKGGNLIR